MNFVHCRRKEPIIAIGGGVCLDVAGLAANLYRRNTPLIKVPTTVMAAVDASIGIKTAVNFHGRKNKMGTYCAPLAVFIDKTFLKTIGDRHLTNGSAEILKMACIKDAQLFELLEKHSAELIQTKFQVGAVFFCISFAFRVGSIQFHLALLGVLLCDSCMHSWVFISNTLLLLLLPILCWSEAAWQILVLILVCCCAESACFNHHAAVYPRHAGGARVQSLGAHLVSPGGLWPRLLT